MEKIDGKRDKNDDHQTVLLSGLDANASNLSAREAGKLHTYKRASLAIQEWKTASS